MVKSEKQQRHLDRLHQKQIGSKRSIETRRLQSEIARFHAQINWEGGSIGEAFAAVLCPAGYIRECYFYYGDAVVPTFAGGFRRHFFRLDFAHLEASCNIELDGPGHKSSQTEDAKRDKILRESGWKVIRIKYKKGDTI